MVDGMTSLKDLTDAVPAYQRWEPAPLEAGHARALQMPTAADLEAIHQQAHQEGLQSGHAEGFEAGYQQGQAQAAQELAQLQAIFASAKEALSQLQSEVAGDLMSLSLEIAKQMLKQALLVKPDLVLPVVHSAMESLPQNTPHPHLHLHPEDAALVRAGMQAEITQGGWKIIEDLRISRGGCRIETSQSETNATIEHRWQRIAASLGQDSSWIDE